MNLEIREDSQYTFTHVEVRNDLPWNITTATLSIYGYDGVKIVDSVAMSVTSNTASYNVNFSVDISSTEWSRSQNYRAEFNIDGVYYQRFFDIVRSPFICRVVDRDLIEEDSSLQDGRMEQAGQADSGTTTTIIDTERREPEQYWYGGKIRIIPLVDSDQVTEHQITNFDNDTNELTFEPARSLAITTENYIIRRSYQSSIDASAEIVKEDLWRNGKRAHLLLDSSQINRLVIYKFFERYWQVKREATDDSADLKFKHYEQKYKDTIGGLVAIMDADDDGIIDEDEARTQVSVTEIIR